MTTRDGEPLHAMEGQDAPLIPPGAAITVKQAEVLDASADYASILNSIFEAATDYGIIATHLDGTFLLWNEGAHRIYGYDAKEVMGRNLRMLHHPDDVASGMIDGIFAAALREGLWAGTVRRRRKNGEEFSVRIVMSARRDATGRAIGFLSISRDITESTRLEQRLRESQAYTREVIESAIDGILITDLEGRITDVNREIELLSGSSRETLIGGRLHEIIFPRAAAEDTLRRVREEGRTTNVELRLERPDGTVADISVSATLMLDSKSRPYGIISAVHDIAESKRLREELEERNRELEVQNVRVQQADRMKSDFLARMSHELRTPLNSIIGFSDFLLTAEGEPLSDSQREYLADILNSGNHLLALINDVLDLAKVESGKVLLHPVPFTLADAIDEVGSSFRLQFQERELHVTTEVDQPLGLVFLDVLRFKQILYNLLSNAVKFTPNGGRVDIRAEPEGSEWFRLQVRDSGIGISRDDIPRIFREFEQASSGAAGVGSTGIGLGLPVTQRLAELMGGSITVESELGVGSAFTVRFPWTRTVSPRSRTTDAGAVV
jgi:PAS domain S-box-containing protein